ncbi:MAG: protein translocase subunit SecF [Actinobacteria bacterium]|nr:protein translocase subunit SecF [Actinomycetota bacterium]
MPKIDFLGHMKIFAVISAILLSVSIGAIVVRGLTFGVEFRGGTVINIGTDTDLSYAEVRDAFAQAGLVEPVIQSVQEGGFIVRSGETDPDEANRIFVEAAGILGIDSAAGNVTTIGPGWGESITNAALMALVLSIVALLLYMSVRFEYKMSVCAVIALLHDVVIVVGIYALAGREITPNTIAALLTITGYSLYDTVVVFHRMKENSAALVNTTFTAMANRSINQVLVRTINTSLTSLVPIIALLLFGGETLMDFAFAITVGLLVSTYSSIGVASPIYVLWKEREPKFQALAKRQAGAA